MKSVCILLLCSSYCFQICLSDFGSNNPNKCVDEATQFRKCWLDVFEKNKDERTVEMATAKERTIKCFTDNKCPIPDFDGLQVKSKAGGARLRQWLNIRSFWQTLPPDVETCVVKQIEKLALDTANDCMEQNRIWIQLHPNEYSRRDIVEFFKNTSILFNQVVAGHFRTMIALNKCHITRGNEDAVKTMKCLMDIKKDFASARCRKIKPCVEELSEKCRNRKDDVTIALQSCSRSRLSKLLKELDGLQQGYEDIRGVSLDSMFYKTNVDTRDSFNDRVESCFPNIKTEREERYSRSNSSHSNTTVYEDEAVNGTRYTFKYNSEAFSKDVATSTKYLLYDPTRMFRAFYLFKHHDRQLYLMSQNELKFMRTIFENLSEEYGCD